MSLLGPYPIQASSFPTSIQHRNIPTKANYNQTDEEFIAQFVALSSDGSHTIIKFQVPQQELKKQIWANCIIAWVVSNKVIREAIFTENMSNVWSVKPRTSIEAVGNNKFVVEMKTKGEVFRVLRKGIWNFRGDMMVFRRATDSKDPVEPQITHMDCWVEMHGVPHDLLTLEGVQSMFKQVGKATSTIQSAFQDGCKIYKQKLRIEIVKPPKDKIIIQGLDGDDQIVKVVYEGVTIICLFCAKIGHDNMVCPIRHKAIRLQ